MLDVEKLDVYRCAIEHLSCVFTWLGQLPRVLVPFEEAPGLDHDATTEATPLTCTSGSCC